MFFRLSKLMSFVMREFTSDYACAREQVVCEWVNNNIPLNL